MRRASQGTLSAATRASTNVSSVGFSQRNAQTKSLREGAHSGAVGGSAADDDPDDDDEDDDDEDEDDANDDKRALARTGEIGICMSSFAQGLYSTSKGPDTTQSNACVFSSLVSISSFSCHPAAARSAFVSREKNVRSCGR